MIGDIRKTDIIYKIGKGVKYSFNKNRYIIENTKEGYLITDTDFTWDGKIVSVKKSLHNYDSMKFWLYRSKITSFKEVI